MKKVKKIVTFGTFDVFHIGHVNILERAKEYGTHLAVGVSTDQMNFDKKQKWPIYRQEHRMALLKALHCVDEVFIEESLALKRKYLVGHQADVLVMGDDWCGQFDEFKDICEVIYLPRTPGVSTTDIVQTIVDSAI